jgi:hypothetical protein
MVSRGSEKSLIAYRAVIRARAVTHGRDPDAVKVLFLAAPAGEPLQGLSLFAVQVVTLQIHGGEHRFGRMHGKPGGQDAPR